MAEITPEEIRTGDRYEQVRAEARRGIAEMKRHRRVALGQLLSLVFENRETIRAMIEEVVRAEHLSDASRVEKEVDAFNAVLPHEHELEATLYVEVADPAELGSRLEELEGVERVVYLEVGGARINGEPRVVAHVDEPPSAFYISFALDADQCDAWLSGSPVAAGVEHSAIRARVELDDEQRRALAADLN